MNGYNKYNYTDLERELIMNYFYTHHDNRTKIVAKALGFPPSGVDWVISQELNKTIERINKEVNKRYDAEHKEKNPTFTEE